MLCTVKGKDSSTCYTLGVKNNNFFIRLPLASVEVGTYDAYKAFLPNLSLFGPAVYLGFANLVLLMFCNEIRRENNQVLIIFYSS